MNDKVLIHADELYKHFGATKAVDGVTFDVYRGEICGLVGENGSGKSTLLSVIAGILKRDRGEVFYKGKKFAPKDLASSNRMGISMIVQEANTIPSLTVAENIFLGIEDPFTKHGFRDLKKMNAMAQKEMQAVGLENVDPKELAGAYSMEQRKLIELAKAASNDPDLLMIDETSTALSHTGRDALYSLMTRTREKGNSVLLISHDLQEVLTYCDRIIVMRDGKIVAEVTASEVDETKLKNLMVGRTLTDKYYREDYDSPVSDRVVLSVRGLGCRKGLKDVSFDLHEGEILGIGGLSESGMHELGRAMYGIEYGIRGEIKTGSGEKVDGISGAIRHGIGYVSKNRDTESLFNLADIKDNICVTCMDRIAKAGFVFPRKMKKFAEESSGLLNIRMNSVDQPVGTLSGGNKQKVALTKWIARGTDIFIMDSPTRGIDVGVKGVIYSLMDDLRKQGKSMVVISEELLELIGMCDRILVLKDGEVSGSFSRSADLREEMIVQYMI